MLANWLVVAITQEFLFAAGHASSLRECAYLLTGNSSTFSIFWSFALDLNDQPNETWLIVRDLGQSIANWRSDKRILNDMGRVSSVFLAIRSWKYAPQVWQYTRRLFAAPTRNTQKFSKEQKQRLTIEVLFNKLFFCMNIYRHDCTAWWQSVATSKHIELVCYWRTQSANEHN